MCIRDRNIIFIAKKIIHFDPCQPDTKRVDRKLCHIIVVDAGSVDQILPISIISTDIVDLISCIFCHLGHFGKGLSLIHIWLAGIEVYDLLRDEYDIQIEFGDICNILAYISIGDRTQDIERLVGALADIARLYKKDRAGLLSGEYIAPKVIRSPQEAFYAEKKSLQIRETSGCISGEFVMCYPPGIPILAPVSYTHLLSKD